jgi:hypothetical protein
MKSIEIAKMILSMKDVPNLYQPLLIEFAEAVMHDHPGKVIVDLSDIILNYGGTKEQIVYTLESHGYHDYLDWTLYNQTDLVEDIDLDDDNDDDTDDDMSDDPIWEEVAYFNGKD